MKWHRKIVENKKPTYADSLGMVWTLLQTRWFGLGIVLRARSDSSFDQRAEANRIRLVLEGQYLEHYEIPRTGDVQVQIHIAAPLRNALRRSGGIARSTCSSSSTVRGDSLLIR